jgi:hypothetical protein
VVAVVPFTIAACGGERQDAHEPKGQFPVQIVSTSFPVRQHLAHPETFAVTVRNSGEKRIPDIAVTLAGFTARSGEPGLSDPSRPLWVVDTSPRGGVTAYDDTWALGALAPGATRSFRWKVTPIVAGTHRLSYRVAAGLAGKATAILAGGGVPGGSVDISVDGVPASTHIDPRTGAVQPGR